MVILMFFEECLPESASYKRHGTKQEAEYVSHQDGKVEATGVFAARFPRFFCGNL